MEISEKKLLRKATQAKYAASPKGKKSLDLAKSRYNSSIKGKATRDEYNSSLDGKAADVKYSVSLKGKVTQTKYAASPKGKSSRIKYAITLKGKSSRDKWANSLGGKEYQKKYRVEYRASLEGKATFAKYAAKRGFALDACQENFTADQLEVLLSKWTGICPCCNKNRKPTIDHFYPLLGKNEALRSNAIENIWLICKSCNSSKGNRDPIGFLLKNLNKTTL
jgi:5-methylcytosine-specific restriction endonuclease McrA